MDDDHEADLDRRVDWILSRIEAKRQPPPTRIEAYRLTEEDEPDHQWIIPGLIEEEGRILLTGPEGSGKSHLVQTMAVQAAGGLPVLDRFPMRIASRVVYMDLEMGRSETRRRFRQLLISAKGAVFQGDLLVYHKPSGVDLSNPRDRMELGAWFSDIEPELIIIDPLYKLMVTDSVYERDVRPTLRVLDQWREIYHCGLILVHHLRKRPQGESSRGRDASDVFGSSVLLRWPETVLMLNEDNIRVAKDRGDIFDSTRQFAVKRGGVWPFSFGDPLRGIDEEVFTYVRGMGPTSGNSVTTGIHKRRADVAAALSRLEADGRIRREGGLWCTT